MTTRLVVCAALRMEATWLRRSLSGDMVRRSGPGPRRARRARESAMAAADAIAIAGIAGGLTPQVGPGDVVVATEVRGPSWAVHCPGATAIGAALRRRGLTVHTGPIVSTPRIVVRPRDRDRLAKTGALCVDTESAWLLADPGDRPIACVRVVADAPPEPLLHPATLQKIRTALRRLPGVASALDEWAASIRPRTVHVFTAPDAPSDPAAAHETVDVVLLVGGGSEPTYDDTETPTHVIADVTDIDLHWLRDARTVGIAAGASAAPGLTARVISVLSGLGPVEVVGGAMPADGVVDNLTKEVRTP